MTNGNRRGLEVSVTTRPLFPPWKDLVPFVQEAVWAAGPVWRGAENFAPTEIRSPNRPARSSVAIPTELPRPTLTAVNTIKYEDSLDRQHKINKIYNFGTSNCINLGIFSKFLTDAGDTNMASVTWSVQ